MRRLLRRFTSWFRQVRDLSIAIGVIVLIVVGAGAVTVSKNGGVCNQGSVDIWITVSAVGGRTASTLPPGECTNVLLQDAEAIWGKTCDSTACTYQAWKVGAGRFDVYDEVNSPAERVLGIRGWGAGSRWQMRRDWDRPALADLDYSLSR